MRKYRTLLAIAAGFVIFCLSFYYYLARDLPSIVTLKDYQPNLVTKVYSYDGQLVAEFYMERRIVVPMERIPKRLVSAFLAAEDTKFFEHEGISYTSILRAFYKNLVAGRVVQGGSTITQQLAKTFFLTPERKLLRKIREVMLAYRIEKSLNKEEILHLYLNQIYFGSGAYGVQAASEAYFGKDVERLTLGESAMLAGLPKAPSKYSPYVNYELAKKRQEFVLNRMIEEGLITPVMLEKALAEKIRLKQKESVENLWVGPYFTEHVRRYLEEKYGDEALYKGGLRVYTTMDVGMQRAANIAVRDGLREYDKRRGYRGPIAKLKGQEETAELRAEMEKKVSWDTLEPGDILKGMVSAFNAKDISLSVDIGGITGVIAREDMEWARLYNPTNDPDGGKQERLDRLFHPGDVVEVMVKALPYSRTMPVPLKLEQPPLAEGALVAMEPETGRVKAMVGGSDFNKTQFNRAVQAMRQPGSAFKPIIYTAAVEKGYTPATIVMDTPIVFEDSLKEEKWRPRNYDEKFFGPTTIRNALARSRNIITIKILKDIGVDYAKDYAVRLGIKSPLAGDLSLALGSSAVTLMELTTAYATISNLGVRPEPVLVSRVVDKDGRELEENPPVMSEALISPETSYIMTSLLQGVIERGTGMRARALGRPAAGKTGTTNELNDAWFIGYVPGLAAGSWVGYDDEKRLGHAETGARAALPVWLKFMKAAVEGTPVRNFKVPDGVEFAKIDPDTGLLAGPSTENAVFEAFKAGTSPREASASKGGEAPEDFLMIDTKPSPEEKPDESEFRD